MSEWFEFQKEAGVHIQGSPQWIEWRGKGIGSSDAAVLLGWSPWKNVSNLYLEKVGLSKPNFNSGQLSAMARGTRLEPIIRQWYEKKIGALFPDAVAEHASPEYSYCRASFDGINKDYINPDKTKGRLIEIKAPNKDDHELARNEIITPKYFAQVQWLLMVAGFVWADYVSYGSNDTYAIVEVKSDALMQDELLKRADLFWTAIKFKLPPDQKHFPRWVQPHSVIHLDEVKEYEL